MAAKTLAGGTFIARHADAAGFASLRWIMVHFFHVHEIGLHHFVVAPLLTDTIVH
jgi:hypothetical protein